MNKQRDYDRRKEQAERMVTELRERGLDALEDKDVRRWLSETYERVARMKARLAGWR